jgi:hypothetical protein
MRFLRLQPGTRARVSTGHSLNIRIAIPTLEAG